MDIPDNSSRVPSADRPRHYRWIVVCLLAPAVAWVAIHPALEMGFNDDWQYVRSARVLADTGNFVYDGWTAPMTIPHAYWGAAIIRIFGFSFLALRLSVLPLWAGCGLLMYLLGRRVGLTPAYSAMASLCFTLSPIAVPVGASFMTDIPAAMLMLLTIYCVMRATAAERVSVAACWLAGAAVTGLVAGMIREILWAAPVSMITVGVLLRWKERGLRVVGILLAGLVTAGAVLAERWHYMQPHAVRQVVRWSIGVRHELPGQALDLVYMGLTVMLVCLPVCMCVAVRAPALRGRARITTCALLALAGAAVLWAPRFGVAPWLSNLITKYGSFDSGQVLVGERPVVLPLAVRILAGLTTLAISAVWVGAVVQVAWHYRQHLRAAIVGRKPLPVFVAVTAPFVAGYLVIVAHQGGAAPTFDRYVLPIAAIVAVYTAWLALRLAPAPPSRAGWATLAVLASFGVANTHDLYAANRAKLLAASWLSSQAVPRHCISAGYEYDGWTQLAEKGVWAKQNSATFPVSIWY